MSAPYYQNQATPPAERHRFSGFAVTALVLGLVGLLGSFLPIINNLTAIGAGVGLVLGVIALWGTRKVMAAFGVALCVAGIIATVAIQAAWANELEQLDRDLQEQQQMTEKYLDGLEDCAEQFETWDPMDPRQSGPNC